MRAVVTEAAGVIHVRDRPEPADPGPGEVVVRPEAVGICGSDYHFFTGELSEAAGGSQFPRVQGHEVAGTITALGPSCRPELHTGQRVALWPLRACGECYPCRVGRPNTCEHFTLIGIHVDGGLQERFSLPQEQVFPIGAGDSSVAAMAEPMSIAVRAVNRAAVRPQERVVVLGAGPIGQCVVLVARERGAHLLVVDLQPSRLALSREMGAETLVWTEREEVVEAARRWAGAGGPPVVGSLTEKELDLLGVSCCGQGEFAEAVKVVERNAALLSRMISHHFPLKDAPEALRFAMSNPTEVMKVVIGGE